MASTDCGFYMPRRSRIKWGRSEELLQLHGRAHVAFDLELAGHVGARRVELARDDPLEVLLRARDRAVGVGRDPFLDGHLAVVDRDRPLAGAVDVEDVGAVHPGGAGLVDPRLQALEELACALGHRLASLSPGPPGPTC